MSRNIHQNKKTKNRKPATTARTPAQAAAVSQPAVTPSQTKTNALKTTAREAEAACYASLPYDIKRIALFTAFTVVLLIVLWIFLR